MNDHVYRVIEIVGSSSDSLEGAINNALQRAGQTVRHLDWFEVKEIRGQIVDDKAGFFQVGLKIGFRIEDA